MKVWEIWTVQPDGWPDPHPCVIVSHPDRAERKDPVEVLMCTSQRATRAPKAHEFLLDPADGLDWPTLCKCDVIYAVPRGALSHRRGEISLARRRPLVRLLISAHAWDEVL